MKPGSIRYWSVTPAIRIKEVVLSIPERSLVWNPVFAHLSPSPPLLRALIDAERCPRVVLLDQIPVRQFRAGNFCTNHPGLAEGQSTGSYKTFDGVGWAGGSQRGRKTRKGCWMKRDMCSFVQFAINKKELNKDMCHQNSLKERKEERKKDRKKGVLERKGVPAEKRHVALIRARCSLAISCLSSFTPSFNKSRRLKGVYMVNPIQHKAISIAKV